MRWARGGLWALTAGAGSVLLLPLGGQPLLQPVPNPTGAQCASLAGSSAAGVYCVDSDGRLLQRAGQTAGLPGGEMWAPLPGTVGEPAAQIAASVLGIWVLGRSGQVYAGSNTSGGSMAFAPVPMGGAQCARIGTGAQFQVMVVPKPASLVPTPGVLFSVEPANFAFVATGVSSGILTRAMDRYMRLSFPPAPARMRRPAHRTLLLLAAAACTELLINVSSADETLGLETDESYQLQIGSPASTLHAASVFGALRGLETFSQLLELTSVDTFVAPAVVIADQPRYPFRGLMIDPARRFLALPLIQVPMQNNEKREKKD